MLHGEKWYIVIWRRKADEARSRRENLIAINLIIFSTLKAEHKADIILLNCIFSCCLRHEHRRRRRSDCESFICVSGANEIRTLPLMSFGCVCFVCKSRNRKKIFARNSQPDRRWIRQRFFHGLVTLLCAPDATKRCRLTRRHLSYKLSFHLPFSANRAGFDEYRAREVMAAREPQQLNLSSASFPSSSSAPPSKSQFGNFRAAFGLQLVQSL